MLLFRLRPLCLRLRLNKPPTLPQSHQSLFHLRYLPRLVLCMYSRPKVSPEYYSPWTELEDLPLKLPPRKSHNLLKFTVVRSVVNEYLLPSSATMELSSIRWPNHVILGSSGDMIWPALPTAIFLFKSHFGYPHLLKYSPTMLAASKTSLSSVVKESARPIWRFSRSALFIWRVKFFKAGALKLRLQKNCLWKRRKVNDTNENCYLHV